MTNTEAIGLLKKVKAFAMSDEKEAFEMAISALEKQEAKRPKIVPNEFCKLEEWNDYLCPSCGRPLISNVNGEWFCGKKQDFCDICGQRIDWSNE